jgi:hypothetical protein
MQIHPIVLLLPGLCAATILVLCMSAMPSPPAPSQKPPEPYTVETPAKGKSIIAKFPATPE